MQLDRKSPVGYTISVPSQMEQTQTAILGRAIKPEDASWSEAAARSILDIKLSPEDNQRRDFLAERAREGKLTAEEHKELDEYRHVGRILELMKAKAKVSLKTAAVAS